MIQLCQKSPQNCIKFRARSKLLRYRGDKLRQIATKIALKSQLIYTCDFEVATSARQKLHRVAATKIACVNGPFDRLDFRRFLESGLRSSRLFGGDRCSFPEQRLVIEPWC